MCVELATCKKCGHIVDKQWTGKRYKDWCDTCKKYTVRFWRSQIDADKVQEDYKRQLTQAKFGASANPALWEKPEPLDGAEVEIDIDAFQDRLTQIM